MNKTKRNNLQRTAFRLDFALRGHSAYTDSASIEMLVELVERASMRLGAPLLLHLEDIEQRDDDQ